MEQRIKDLYNDEILQEIIQRFGIGKNEIRILDSFESFIYEFKNISGEYILRISHSIRRSEALIHGEVDWINFLAEHGASVSKAVLSKNDNLVEVIPDNKGGNFLATAFVKAQGKPPMGKWTPDLYETYGQQIGKMHSVTKHFTPTTPQRKRPEWNDPIFNFVEQFLPDGEFIARKKYKDACKHVNPLPKNNENYGLIHQDAHGGNLLIDESGKITFFDFDDCCYSWFINDIAIVLFYIVMESEDWPVFAQNFLIHFLRGYLGHCSLDLELLKVIPNFLKIREIELYAVIQRDFDMANIEDEWCNRFMKDRKYMIEHDVPFIAYDFGSLISALK